MSQIAENSSAEKPPVHVPTGAEQQALQRLVEIYHRCLNDHATPREFLRRHGLGDARLWTQHQLGYADGSLQRLLPRQGAVRDTLVELGVLLSDGRERFAGQWVVPIWDVEGQLINLWGLPLEPDASPVCLSGLPLGAWNIAAVKVRSEILILGSILDALAAHAAGYTNAIVVPGGWQLSAEDTDAFRIHAVQAVTVVSGDRAAGRRLIEQLRGAGYAGACRCRQLTEPLHRLLVSQGPEGLKAWLASEPNGFEIPGPGLEPSPDGFTVQLGARRYEIRGPERGPRQLKATVKVDHAGRSHVDTLDLFTARCRRRFCQDLARILEEPAKTIETEVARLVTVCDSRTNAHEERIRSTSSSLPTSEAIQEAEALGRRDDLVEQILADFDRCGLVGERANKLLCYLAMTSRKLDCPLSVLTQSSSGTGKSALHDATLGFCPPEDLHRLTTLSARSLFYLGADSLRHKVLAIEEAEGVAASAYALRTLVTTGELSIQVTTRDGAAGSFASRENRVAGPVSVFLTTTDPDIDPETRSRFWVLSMDESFGQTEAILARQRQAEASAAIGGAKAREVTRQRHWTFQRLLRPLAVINPYAEALTFGGTRVQSRRDQPKYLTLIRTVTLLRQMRKPIKRTADSAGRNDYVEVDLDDIRLANELTAEIMGHTLEELSRPGFDLLMQLERMPERERFSRREVCLHTGWSYARVHRYLQELLTLEYVVVASAKAGMPRSYRLIYRGEGKDGQRFALGLRPVEELQALCTGVAPGLHDVRTATTTDHSVPPERVAETSVAS